MAAMMHPTLKMMRRRWGHVRRSRGPVRRLGIRRRYQRARSAPARPEAARSDREAQVSADDHALDLTRALADLEDLGVPVLAAHQRLVHEPVPAEHLGG